jgi:hypothetical protein
MGSSWVRREIEYALVSVQYKDRLIPVEVEPTTDFPWILRHMPWVKGNPEEASPRVAGLLEAAGVSKVDRDGLRPGINTRAKNGAG